MQTITLHLRSLRKQRNSYALGESVETESHHHEGMAEWLCDGLQIHLPWFESEYPLQHTQTQEIIMSKNAYEIRLDTLRMAKEMADTQFCLEQDIMYRMIDQAQEKRMDIEEVIKDHSPMMYQPVDLIETANKLYAYVSEKQ